MFSVGEKVQWFSSGTEKFGEVVEIVQPYHYPTAMNPSHLGDYRGHVSYCVKGGERGRNRKALYWPRVNLLKSSTRLTDNEVDWCHMNVERIRKLMLTGE